MNGILYSPEGLRQKTEPLSLPMLEHARNTRKILEAKAVMCDSEHNLIVDLDGIRGVIPREEAALGIREGSVKEVAVLSRVNKQICFRVNAISTDGVKTTASLSRLSVQRDALEYMLSAYRPGDVVPARITHLEPFGAFADIGCGIVGLISIENVSVSRIAHPRDRFFVGQDILTVIREVDVQNRRFALSHKELLGTWAENAARFSVGQTVCGTVRSVEDYGIFVELAPNLAGLAEYRDGVRAGDQATVYIKNIIPEKMKIKLSLIDAFAASGAPGAIEYFCTDAHIDAFVYSPPCCPRVIRTDF